MPSLIELITAAKEHAAFLKDLTSFHTVWTSKTKENMWLQEREASFLRTTERTAQGLINYDPLPCLATPVRSVVDECLCGLRPPLLDESPWRDLDNSSAAIRRSQDEQQQKINAFLAFR